VINNFHTNKNQLKHRIMKNKIIFLSLLVIFSGKVFSQTAGVPIAEYNALKTFYVVMSGGDWINNTNWLDTTNHSVADWFGLSVENNHVTKIELVNNNLDGKFTEEFTALTELTKLELDSNLISGTLDIDFGVFKKLDTISLTRNELTGQVPDGLGKIFGLTSIKLSANQLSGEIPSRLINCKELVEFHVDSNMYTTANIEPIFRWGNLDHFKENFLYSPQYDIGKTDTVTKDWGDNLTIEIEGYTPGSADTYQWFKDSVLLPGETSAQYSVNQITSADSGMYFCQVKNTIATELTLSSKPIKVVVNGSAAGAGVPLDEYLALVEIYDTLMGDNWKNSENWLDTTFYSVKDWYGISVDFGHVIKFEMPDNNLTHMPYQLNEFAELEVIDLSSGDFTDSVPNYGNLDGLTELNVGDNNFNFKQLTPVTRWANYNNFKNDFIYTPQPTNIGADTLLQVQYNDTINVTVNGYDADENDNFEWFKNGISVQSGPENTVKKKAWFDDNNTVYHYEVTNSLLPDLTLISGDYTIKVNYSSNDSIALSGLKMVYDTLQEIWTGDTIFNWPLVTAEEGYVSALDFSGLKMDGEISPWLAAFDSLTWLDLSNNNLEGEVPDFDPNKSATLKSVNSVNPTLEYLNLANNNFVFADLEPTADELNGIDEFIYSPQPKVGISLDTTILKYQDISFRMWNYKPGFDDVYTWFKDGEVIPGESNLVYFLKNVALADSGSYTFSISNTLFPDLVLTSDTIRLKIAIPVGISETGINKFNIYPNPAGERIYIDTHNKEAGVKLFNLDGKLILEKNNFVSDWINVTHVKRGVYVVFIIDKENYSTKRKIILK